MPIRFGLSGTPIPVPGFASAELHPVLTPCVLACSQNKYVELWSILVRTWTVSRRHSLNLHSLNLWMHLQDALLPGEIPAQSHFQSLQRTITAGQRADADLKQINVKDRTAEQMNQLLTKHMLRRSKDIIKDQVGAYLSRIMASLIDCTVWIADAQED